MSTNTIKLIILAMIIALVSVAISSRIETIRDVEEKAPEVSYGSDEYNHIYYVSKEGDNKGEGGQDNPWETIQYGINQLVPGDLLYIMPGVYNEKVAINQSGEANHPITIMSYTPGTVSLDGEGISKGNHMFYLGNVDHIRIEGLEIRSNKAIKFATGFYIEGACRGIELINNTIHDIEGVKDGHAIGVYGTDGEIPISELLIEGNKVYDCKLGSREAITIDGNIDGFKIKDNVIGNVDNTGIACIGFQQTAPTNDQARNGEISGNDVAKVSSKYNPVYSGDESAEGIYVNGGKNIAIYNNKVDRCDIGIEVASERSGKTVTDVLVYDNYISNCRLYGIFVGGLKATNGSASNNHFEYNSLYNNQASIAIQNATDNQFNNNMFCGSTQLIKGDESANNFTNNLWFSDVTFTQDMVMFEDMGYVNPEAGDFTIKNGFSGYGVRYEPMKEEVAPEPLNYRDMLVELGIIQGDGAGLNENNPVSREEFVAVLYRLLEPGKMEAPIIEEMNFVDVADSHWAHGYIEYAYLNDLSKGVSPGEFGLGEAISYRQGIVMLLRALNYEADWDRALEEGRDIGLFIKGKNIPDKFLRRQMFELICRSLVAKENGSSHRLIDEFGKMDATLYNKFMRIE